MKNAEHVFVFVAIVLITSIVLLVAVAGSMNSRKAAWSLALLNAAEHIKADPDVAEGAIAAFMPHYASCSKTYPPIIEEKCISAAESAVRTWRKHSALPSRLEGELKLVRKLMASVASTQEETNR